MITHRFIHDLKTQILEKVQVRKNLVQKNFRLIQEIKNNVKRRQELTKEIRELKHQLRQVRGAGKKTPKRVHERIPRKIDRINLAPRRDIQMPEN